MKTILLVDDLELNRKFILPIFEENYYILEAESGFEALTILKNNHVDLIITDIFMDDMDGYTLIRKIRENIKLKEIPIIAITERDEASQADAIAAGADYFVSRPMDSNELRREVLRLTGQDVGRKDLIHTDFLLQYIPGVVIVYRVKDTSLEVLACSRGLGAITGWETDEIGQNVKAEDYNKIHPSDLQLFNNTIAKIVKTKSRAKLSYRGIKKDGSTIWLTFQGSYIGEEDGYPIVEALILDATNDANMYQSLLDQTDSLVTVVDANTFEVLYANQAAKDTVGTSAGDYIGNVCYKHIFGLDKPCSHCIVNNSSEDIYVLPEKEFEGRYFQQTFRRMLWHGKKAIMEFTSDITVQREKMALLEQQKNIQESLLDTIPAGIMEFKFVGDNIQIVSVNKSICEMMGMEKGKALGEAKANIVALTHPDDVQIVLEAAKTLSEEDSYVEYEYRHFYRSRNDYVWVLGQGKSARNADGYVHAYVNYTDITARKEVEKLQDKLERTGAQAAAKAEFYSQMSHDMRTPMNGILGLADIALEENDIDTVHQDLEKIKESGKYVLNLINDTLDLQRIEGGRLKLEPQIVRCDLILSDVVEMITPAVREKNLTMNVAVAEKKLMNWYVKVDVMRFKQVIMNILSNAVKYTPTGGSIDFRVSELSREGNISHDIIEISDTGVGMSPEFLKHGIFKPFSQERNEMSMMYPGSGLGLSIVKKLVEMMGGTIEVNSILNEGTTFYIYIDLELIDHDEVEQNLKKIKGETIQSIENMEGTCVLLCEDHPLNAEIAQRLLKRAGCHVEWAENGTIGVEIFNKSKPGHFDVILMDIRMPIMNGLEATKAIRALQHPDAKKIPIIAMSANAYEDDIKKSIDAGMNDHLSKPVNTQILLETIGKYIQK